MANDSGHGGYRQPSNPAPVSGPGAHSQRTDRGPVQHQITGGSYGSSQEFQQQQSASPLAAPSQPQGGGAGVDFSALTGLGAPSAMPDVPITDGAAAGAGVGPDAMFGGKVNPESEEARSLGRWIPTLIQVADSDGSTPAFKAYVRQLIANL